MTWHNLRSNFSSCVLSTTGYISRPPSSIFYGSCSSLEQMCNENRAGQVSVRLRCLMSVGCHHGALKKINGVCVKNQRAVFLFPLTLQLLLLTSMFIFLFSLVHFLLLIFCWIKIYFQSLQQPFRPPDYLLSRRSVTAETRTDPLLNCGFGRSPCRSSWKKSWPMWSLVIWLRSSVDSTPTRTNRCSWGPSSSSSTHWMASCREMGGVHTDREGKFKGGAMV